MKELPEAARSTNPYSCFYWTRRSEKRARATARAELRSGAVLPPAEGPYYWTDLSYRHRMVSCCGWRVPMDRVQVDFDGRLHWIDDDLLRRHILNHWELEHAGEEEPWWLT